MHTAGVLQPSRPHVLNVHVDGRRSTSDTATAKVLYQLLTQDLKQTTVLVGGASEAILGMVDALAYCTRRSLSSFRLLVSPSTVSSATFRAHAIRLARHGSEIRVHDAVDLDVAIFDRTWVMSLTPPNIVRDTREALRFTSLAEAKWATAKPLCEQYSLEGIGTLPPRTIHVLRLLAEGFTDDSVARRIGVSVRTVRNDVADTMNRLNTTSRFQLGTRMTQLGLI